MRVMSVVGTRPELIKLSRIISVLDICFHHILVHTGQNYDYELNEIFFKEMKIRQPNFFLDASGKTPTVIIANIMSMIDTLLEEIKPDAILVLGDTNSSLSVYPAKRRKIPVFHMEAGNRCFDQRVPEEINRKIVDHISDINMVYTEHARRYLLAEGLPADCIIKTGSPMKEVLDYYQKEINSSNVLDKLEIKENKYFVVSIHREENVDSLENLKNLIDAINKVISIYNYPIIFSCHPRTKERIKKLEEIKLHSDIQMMPPFGFFDYVALQKKAFCTISDSGTITEETSILGFPAITVRQAHERPEGVDEGTVIMAGVSPDHIIKAIELTVKQFQNWGKMKIVPDYDVPQVSWKVAKIISSYTEYINQKVWRRQI